jgi:hypothetical protein
MKLWIDAACGDARLRVFGMSLAERHIRDARHKNAEPLPAIVSGSADAFAFLPPSLRENDVALEEDEGTLGRRLVNAVQTSDEPLLVAAGHTALDQRLYGELRQRSGNWLVTNEEGTAALLRLEPGVALDGIAEIGDWAGLIAALLYQPGISQLRQEDFTAHIAVLRRDLPFWLRRVENERERAELERFMF